VRFRFGDESEKVISSLPLDPPDDDPLSYLISVVRGRLHSSGLSSIENNLIVSEILEAAHRSAATSQTIRLPLNAGDR
jgi:hypothetical protein